MVLLGRDRERAVIDATLDAVREGTAKGLLLLGEAGIGKSALLEYAVERAEDMLVLRAGGVESETQLTWAGLHSLLRQHLDAIDLLPAPQRMALRSGLGLEDAPNRGPFLVSAAVVSLLGMLAEARPLVVVVDDVQWMDRESIGALAFALRRFDADHVAMVFACRDTEPGAPDSSTLGERFVELVVPPLDERAVEEFLDTRVALTLDHRIRRRIIEAARGNPLALTELSEENAISVLESGSIPLATRLERGFLRRARALSDSTQWLLLLAAADDSPDVGALLGAGDQVRVGDAELLEAQRSRLLMVTDGRVHFAHPLVRSAVYRDATPEQRRRAHLALASATAPADSAKSTWHRAAAATGPDEDLALDLEAVGSAAQRRAAMLTSARAYRRAAELTTDVGRQVRCLTNAAEASWQIGNVPLSAQLVGSARERAHTPVQVARAEHLRGRLQVNTGIVLEGFEILYAAARTVSGSHPEMAAGILVDAYRAASYESVDARVGEVGELAGTLAQTDDPPPAAALVAGIAALWDGDHQRAAPLLHVVTDRSVRTDDASLLVWAAMASLYLGDNAGALRYATRAAVIAREQGALGTLAAALEMTAFADLPTSLDRAESSALEGLQAARETQQTPSAALHLSTLCAITAYRGDEIGCQAAAAQVFELARRHGLALCEGRAVAALGLLELTLGKPQLALDRLERLLETTAHPMIRLSFAADLVEAATRADLPDRATGALAYITSWAESTHLPTARAAAARCLALARGPEGARPLFEESLALQEGHGETLDLARTHLLLGEHLRRGRRRADARPHLRAAWDTFDRLGARPWAERARAELRATGESARSRRSLGTEDLTPQERHIAALVAEGATSKQVAARLFLSPRTVDYHLRKVFTKTGISSRAELRTLDLER